MTSPEAVPVVADERDLMNTAVHLMRDTFLAALEAGSLTWEQQGEFQHQFFDGYAEAKRVWGVALVKRDALGKGQPELGPSPVPVPPQAITAEERNAAALVNAMATVKRHVLHQTSMWQAAASDDVVVATMGRVALIQAILEAAAPHLAAAIRELHKPVVRRLTALNGRPGMFIHRHGCDLGPHPEDYPDWPCSTAELVYAPEEIAEAERS